MLKYIINKLSKLFKKKQQFTEEQMKRFDAACCGDNPCNVGCYDVK